jgi:hypothetical protein
MTIELHPTESFRDFTLGVTFACPYRTSVPVYGEDIRLTAYAVIGHFVFKVLMRDDKIDRYSLELYSSYG